MSRAPMSAGGSVAQLSKSERGQRVLKILFRLLNGPGSSLDSSNQAAVLVLVERAFNGELWQVLELIEETVNVGDIDV